MSLIRVSTFKQPVQRFDCNITSDIKKLIEYGRMALEIGNKSGIDRYSGIHRYLLDGGEHAWMPVKERIIFNPAPTLFKSGIADYYADTVSAGHPNRLYGFAKFEGQLFV